MNTYLIEEIEKFYTIGENGECFSKIKNRFLKPRVNNYGYMSYFITHPYRKHIFIHTLVALKYIGKRPNGYDINHKDNNKGNNHFSNLEYISHSENILKSFREHNKQPYWKNKHRPSPSLETLIKMSNAKLKPIEVYISGKFYKKYNSISELCKELNISYKTLSRNKLQYKQYTFKRI